MGWFSLTEKYNIPNSLNDGGEDLVGVGLVKFGREVGVDEALAVGKVDGGNSGEFLE
jgi:hypothetical protein